MTEDVLVPGARDVRGSLDSPESDACVVACPPHPQYGGSRRDGRLRAVADALGDRGIACLRFDYGEWDDGEGERRDVGNAVGWAAERYDPVGLFGYSFGGTMALVAAPDAPIAALSLLAPAASLSGLDADPVAALDEIDVPVQVLYGSRDTTADSGPIAERARELGGAVEELSADHFFIGQESKVGDRVAGFLAGALDDASDG